MKEMHWMLSANQSWNCNGTETNVELFLLHLSSDQSQITRNSDQPLKTMLKVHKIFCLLHMQNQLVCTLKRFTRIIHLMINWQKKIFKCQKQSKNTFQARNMFLHLNFTSIFLKYIRPKGVNVSKTVFQPRLLKNYKEWLFFDICYK